MATADMFLKIKGVSGETSDKDHPGEIEIVSWSWGMQAPTVVATGQPIGKATLSELHLVKRVDQSSPTLMGYVRANKEIAEAVLTVRKAGGGPLEYFKIELANARLTSLQAESQGVELVERLSVGFSKIRVSYTPQDSTGARGGGTNVFEADAYVG